MVCIAVSIEDEKKVSITTDVIDSVRGHISVLIVFCACDGVIEKFRNLL
jgi:hypothetical protein